MVQVVGAVREPGVFTLNLGARVIDAVFAAGGFATDADQSSINLARPLSDGEQILVLTQQASQASGAIGGAGVGAATPSVNINRADLAALDSLPGIGPTLAQRILDYRQANGGFRSLSDLGKVAGIGPALLAKLKPAISL
jgi:competence protein ComEA